MSARLLRLLVVALVVVALHLGAHLSADGFRAQSLPEDEPAFVGNPALAPETGRPFADAARRALSDPAAAWEPAGAAVGRDRWRPATGLLLAAERSLGGGHALALAGLVGIALHIATALGACGLAADFGARSAGRWLAGLATACAPLALAAAAWPARQGFALAGALGVLGVRLMLRRRGVAAVSGALALGASALSHEAGFGAAAAALVLLAHRARREGRRGAAGAAAAVLLPVAAAVAWRVAVLPPHEPAGGARPDAFDALAGVVIGLLTPLLPARLHLAGGFCDVHGWARVVAPFLLAGAAAFLWRRRGAAGPAALGAALAAAFVLTGVARSGGAAWHAAYSYVLLPYLATGCALVLETAAVRPGASRAAAAAAAALLVGANVAGTLRAAPAFRSRARFAAAARAADPGSVVAHAWTFAEGVRGVPGGAPPADLLALLPEARAVSARIVADDGAPTPAGLALARDAAAGTAVAGVLGGYCRRLGAVLTPAERARRVDLVPLVQAATTAAPRWEGAWLAAAQVHTALGSVDAALAAAQRAVQASPRDARLWELTARLSLRLGRTGDAVDAMDIAAPLAQAEADAAAAPVRRDHILLRAAALSADADTRHLPRQFDQAARLLESLLPRGALDTELRTALYDNYLRWGDTLVSLQQPALARLSYKRAVALGGTGSDAATHLQWLEAGLQKELAEANAAIERAQQDPGAENPANALMQLAIVLCKAAEWERADEVFARIREAQGGDNPALLFNRARYRYALRDDTLDLAESELREVIVQDPSLVEAHFRLAEVLLQMGRPREAAVEYRLAADLGAAYEWGVDALDMARRLELQFPHE